MYCSYTTKEYEYGSQKSQVRRLSNVQMLAFDNIRILNRRWFDVRKCLDIQWNQASKINRFGVEFKFNTYSKFKLQKIQVFNVIVPASCRFVSSDVRKRSREAFSFSSTTYMNYLRWERREHQSTQDGDEDWGKSDKIKVPNLQYRTNRSSSL